MFWQKDPFLSSDFAKKAYILGYLRINSRGELMHYEEEEEWDNDEEERDYWRDDE